MTTAQMAEVVGHAPLLSHLLLVFLGHVGMGDLYDRCQVGLQ